MVVDVDAFEHCKGGETLALNYKNVWKRLNMRKGTSIHYKHVEKHIKHT